MHDNTEQSRGHILINLIVATNYGSARGDDVPLHGLVPPYKVAL